LNYTRMDGWRGPFHVSFEIIAYQKAFVKPFSRFLKFLF